MCVGVLDAVKNAFNRSTDAVKHADGTADTVNRSVSVRDDAIKGLENVQPINTQDLQKLAEDLATRPNLTPIATQVRIQTYTQHPLQSIIRLLTSTSNSTKL